MGSNNDNTGMGTGDRRMSFIKEMKLSPDETICGNHVQCAY